MYLQAAIDSVTHCDTSPIPDGGAKPPERQAPAPAPRDMAEVVRAVVDGWPPLSNAQRERLSVLLRPGRLPCDTQ